MFWYTFSLDNIKTTSYRKGICPYINTSIIVTKLLVEDISNAVFTLSYAHLKSNNVFWVTAGFGSTTGRTGTIHSHSAQDNGHLSSNMSRGHKGIE
jgi:hypothetical protein